MPILSPIFVPGPTIPIPDWLLPYTEYDATYKGSLGDDNWSNTSSTFKDVVYTNGGNDYISTHGGDDKVTITQNQQSAYVDVGDGNDIVKVNARGGNYTVDLGDGADKITVTGGGNIHIMAGNGDGADDTFTFSSAYTGHATVAETTWGDDFHFTGSGWSAGKLVDGGQLFTNDHGGSVLVQGITDYHPMTNDGGGWWHV